MNETNDAAAVRPGRGAWWLALVALGMATATAAALWYLASAIDPAMQEREASARRVVLTEEENAQLRRQVSALTRRFDDDDALDRSLREELLGISERATLLEQAIKRVSENRMDTRVRAAPESGRAAAVGRHRTPAPVPRRAGGADRASRKNAKHDP